MLYIDRYENGEAIYKKSPVICTHMYNISFPYTKYMIRDTVIINLFNELRCDNIELIDDIFNVVEQYKYLPIIEYFQEDAELSTKRINMKSSTLEQFSKLKFPKKNISMASVKKFAYENIQFCSEFNPMWLVAIIKHYRNLGMQVENLLDFSAGRGSRMVACAATNVNYFGVDPCETSYPGFIKLQEFVKSCGAANKSTLFKAGFETNWQDGHDLPKFDMMFTSPPYFNLEIYEDNPNQSTVKFPNLESWLENFLKFSMAKTISMLRSEGLMLINIDNPINLNIDYVGKMLEFKFEDAVYLGKKNYKTGKRLFSVYIWRKL